MQPDFEKGDLLFQREVAFSYLLFLIDIDFLVQMSHSILHIPCSLTVGNGVVITSFLLEFYPIIIQPNLEFSFLY